MGPLGPLGDLVNPAGGYPTGPRGRPCGGSGWGGQGEPGVVLRGVQEGPGDPSAGSRRGSGGASGLPGDSKSLVV